ncbi:unnamed protein product, partial [Didymodactylos carnosus]
YNGGALKSKPNNMSRDILSSKSRAQKKPVRVSRHDVLSTNNDHLSDAFDYSQHDTPHHSSDSGSPVGPRAEVVVNRNVDPTASPVPNSSLQQVTAFPATTNMTNEHNLSERSLDQFESAQSNDDTRYNNSNQQHSSTLSMPNYQDNDNIQTAYQNNSNNNNNTSFYPNARTVNKPNDTEKQPQQTKETPISVQQQNVEKQLQTSTTLNPTSPISQQLQQRNLSQRQPSQSNIAQEQSLPTTALVKIPQTNATSLVQQQQPQSQQQQPQPQQQHNKSQQQQQQQLIDNQQTNYSNLDKEK